MKNIIKSLFIALALAMAAGQPAHAAPTPAAAAAPTGQTIQAPTASVAAMHGRIELSVSADTPVRFYIYSITGQLVKAVDLAQGTVAIELPRGYYIVKCSEWSRQVVVR